MQYTSTILMAAGLITSVSAHGSILTPKPRIPGAAMAAACGQQVEVNQASDHNGNIQGMLQVAASQSDYDAAACNIWQCKGYKYADNTDLVQSWTAGQVVPFTFNVAAPHTGTANVSIIDTAANTVIKQLLYYDVFASVSTGVTSNETSFSITIPDDLPSTCATPGGCVVQHWWDAASIDQTYESCVDFTVGSASGSGSASSAVASSAVASSTVAASSAVVASSSSIAVVASSSAVASSVSSVAAIATSAAVSSAAQTTTFAALPTTLATVTKASSTSSAAAVATSAAPEEDDDTCDA
ncbi:hypothetical protein BCIN_05g06830 [Botrytis cinerea B05.10]|uniref:Chitin-binding type-4 domain-containing protein n=3 Tax=Botryotinia fuckeliana TaxID=40559 RepID=A0A384JIN0_BOTFB|nr:hypothetical protein BCIN_05g06830 [Botrytis cinerea B05.10]ATZ50322.1 hypothetical protein BCIN_05g06830 [Botrytis cinerea B05.10]EMR80479.1 putative chitin binding protein [Botrytis cinerea BcDW1]CCD53379.1 hypothetical protein BofuT4_P134240.1 [Botrytis cinerea T4]